ncbi:septum formation initiator family protein [Streptomyces piniterrae]|uniref:Septum formation initiator family protein n=1 Tax=Streptomyces piniterrae TaxID=2571125 RepID=A0A4U0NAP5_9ACTN|nr:septum formation initiator family protein [Streptomyces piniterrae]TJZ50969.1 septum formation initiator family protein [Streptomyces piniterrae]
MSGQGRPHGGQGRLSALFPAGGGTAARTPFVLLVVVLLGSGLIVLLLLNSALNQGSFELSKLEKQTEDLTDEQQALQQEVDAYSAPAALEKRARRLGMVPGGNPAFLLPDGTVRGKPHVVTSDASVMRAGAALPALGPLRAPGTAVVPVAPVAPVIPGAPGGSAAPAPAAPPVRSASPTASGR